MASVGLSFVRGSSAAVTDLRHVGRFANQPNVSIRSAPVAPLMDQHRRYVRYQVALNRPFFGYIRTNQYYDANRQASAVRVSEQARFKGLNEAPEGAFVALPFDTGDQPGMLEIKSAWRVLDPEFDQPARYYWRLNNVSGVTTMLSGESENLGASFRVHPLWQSPL